MTDRKKQSQIPDFKSRQELATFWDTHDVSDYWEELELVKLRVANKLRKEVEAKGVGPAMLARMWILKQLRTS